MTLRARRFRYPDGFVLCAPMQGGDKVAHDPVVIFEVLSESTARTDLVTKNHEYSQTPSVRWSVILARDAPRGTMFERVGEDWVGHLLATDSVLRMPEIRIEGPLVEFYEGVDPRYRMDRWKGRSSNDRLPPGIRLSGDLALADALSLNPDNPLSHKGRAGSVLHWIQRSMLLKRFFLPGKQKAFLDHSRQSMATAAIRCTVSRSSAPLQRDGRKWRWKAATTCRVAASSRPVTRQA